MAIYLRALQVRLERLQNKPQRDEDLTKQVAPFAAQLPDLSRPARWLLEEWRVALFAPELKAVGRPSPPALKGALAPGQTKCKDPQSVGEGKRGSGRVKRGG